MSHRQCIPQPSAAVLATFAVPIPKSLASKRILTRIQLGRAVRESRYLYSACQFLPDADATQPPTIAAKLYAAHTVLSAGRQRTTLSAVLGDAATPCELALIIRGGNRHVELCEFFGECMLRLLTASTAPRDESVTRLRDQCIETLSLVRNGDPDIARVIFSDATLRKRFGCVWASRGLAPDDLLQCLGAVDFRSAVEALCNESENTCKNLIDNPALTPRQLEDVFTVLNAPQRDAYWHGCAAGGALKHPACQPALFPMIASANWRHIADCEPDLVAQLWSKFHAHEHAWLSVFAALMHCRWTRLQWLPQFVDRVCQWGQPAREMAAVLLASSPDPATASLGIGGFSARDS